MQSRNLFKEEHTQSNINNEIGAFILPCSVQAQVTNKHEQKWQSRENASTPSRSSSRIRLLSSGIAISVILGPIGTYMSAKSARSRLAKDAEQKHRVSLALHTSKPIKLTDIDAPRLVAFHYNTIAQFNKATLKR